MNTSVTPEVQRDCSSKSPGIVVEKQTNKLYFNRYWAQCAGVPRDEILCGPIKLESSQKPTQPPLRHHRDVPLNISFSPDTPKTNPCAIGHVLDPGSKECQRVISMKRAIKKKLILPFFNRYKFSIKFAIDSQFGKTDGDQSRKIIINTGSRVGVKKFPCRNTFHGRAEQH